MFPKNSHFDQVDNSAYYESLRKEIEERTKKAEVDNNAYYDTLRKEIEERTKKAEVTLSPQQEKTSKLAQHLDDLQEALVYENYDEAERLVEEARKLV